MIKVQTEEQPRERKNQSERKRYYLNKERISQKRRAQYRLKHPVIKRDMKKVNIAKQAPSLEEKIKQYPRMNKEECDFFKPRSQRWKKA